MKVKLKVDCGLAHTASVTHRSSPTLRHWFTQFTHDGGCSNSCGSSAIGRCLPGFLDDACDEGPEFVSGRLLLFTRLLLLADLLNCSSHGLVEFCLLGLGITPIPLSSSSDSPFMELCHLLLHELRVFAFIIIAKMYSRLAYPRLGSKSCNIGPFLHTADTLALPLLLLLQHASLLLGHMVEGVPLTARSHCTSHQVRHRS